MPHIAATQQLAGRGDSVELPHPHLDTEVMPKRVQVDCLTGLHTLGVEFGQHGLDDGIEQGARAGLGDAAAVINGPRTGSTIKYVRRLGHG